jgi:hypothetical protein
MKKVLAIAVLIIGSQIASAQSDSSYYTVRLSSFDVSVSNNITKLHWKTVCFLQYANFQIQKSANGTDFITINSFTADRFRCQQPFDFTDSLGINQGNVFYRINVGNIDGRFYQSVVRRVYIKEKGFDLISVYPTIVTYSINFSLSNSDNETFRAVIINQSGSIVKNKKLQVPKGLSNYNFETGDLSSGYYWLQVINDLGDLRTTKFVKQ